MGGEWGVLASSVQWLSPASYENWKENGLRAVLRRPPPPFPPLLPALLGPGDGPYRPLRGTPGLPGSQGGP